MAPSKIVSASNATRRAQERGFSIAEITITLGLLGILVVAGVNMIMVMNKSSRRQALHTTALEMAQGKLEELRATTYNPPVSPYLASTNSTTTNVVLTVNSSGSNTIVAGIMKTLIAPLALGHMVTVTVTTTNIDQPVSATLQTLINKKAGGQP